MNIQSTYISRSKIRDMFVQRMDNFLFLNKVLVLVWNSVVVVWYWNDSKKIMTN